MWSRPARLDLAWLALAVLALTACGPRAESPELAALRSGDPADCLRIPEPSERGACVSFAAAEAARAGRLDAARALCDHGGLGLWQGECWFLVADAAEAVGEVAEALCERAGPARGQCLGHAASREARALLASPGTERAALQRLTEAVSRYRSGPRAREEAEELVLAQVARRDPGAPFSPALCGDLPERLCAEALLRRAGVGRDGARCPPPTWPPLAEEAGALRALAEQLACG